jgi:hypothetical protein
MTYLKSDEILESEASHLCSFEDVNKGIPLDKKPFFCKTGLKYLSFGDRVPIEHQSCFVTSVLTIRD